MISAALCGVLIALIAIVFLVGRAAGRNALRYEIESDVQTRRELLEHLARLERCRIVGRE